MSQRIRAHLRSNVVGYIAIFLFAMGGTAFAIDGPLPGQNQVGSADIINGEVQQPDIGSQAVGTDAIKNNQVTHSDLAADAVRSGEIANGQVGNVDLADGSVNSAKVLDNSLTIDDLGTQSVGSDELTGTGFGNNGFNGDEEIIDGSILGFDIANDTLGGNHIADGTLSGGDIADGSLSQADIGDSVTAGANHDLSVVTVAGGGTDVVSAGITTEASSTLIVNSVAELEGADADERAQCFIKLDGSTISLGYESTFDDIGTTNAATLAANGFATSVAAGPHTVTMQCFSISGTIVKDDAGINVISVP